MFLWNSLLKYLDLYPKFDFKMCNLKKYIFYLLIFLQTKCHCKIVLIIHRVVGCYTLDVSAVPRTAVEPVTRSHLWAIQIDQFGRRKRMLTRWTLPPV